MCVYTHFYFSFIVNMVLVRKPHLRLSERQIWKTVLFKSNVRFHHFRHMTEMALGDSYETSIFLHKAHWFNEGKRKVEKPTNVLLFDIVLCNLMPYEKVRWHSALNVCFFHAVPTNFSLLLIFGSVMKTVVPSTCLSWMVLNVLNLPIPKKKKQVLKLEVDFKLTKRK